MGWELGCLGRERGQKVTALDLPEFDLTDAAAVKETLGRASGDLVINAAAYTAVDRAESESETAFAVNRDGPANLAHTCRALGLPLVHISTDYVFDGNKESPYTESDPIRPMTVYGRSKAEGERAVREAWDEHIIIRTAWLYSVHGGNFVKTMLRLGAEQERISVVDDQQGCPTYARDLAEALFDLADSVVSKTAHWGTYHYAGSGSATWYEFTVRIFELARPDTPLQVKEVLPITTDQFPTAARRPPDSRLDCSAIGHVFGIRPPHWSDSLQRMLKRLLKDRES